MKNRSIPFADSAIFKTGLFTSLIFSFYTTFGARMDQGDSVGEALLYATWTTTLVAFLWTVVLAFFPRLRANKARTVAAILIVVLCGLIAGVSGLQNQIKLSGRQTLATHGKEVVTEHEVRLREASRNSIALQDLIPILRIQAKLYADRRDGEYYHGAYTGVAGPGVVEAALRGISGEFSDLADGIEAGLRNADEHRREAAAILVSMRSAARAASTHEERMKKFAPASEALRVVIGKLNSKGTAIAVQFGVESMAGELGLRQQFSTNTSTAEHQRTAIARIQNELRQSANTLKPFIERALATEAVQAPYLERIGAQEAVIRYWYTVIPQWGIALVADLWVAIYLALTMTFVSDRGRFGALSDTTSLTDGLNIFKTIREHLNELEDTRPVDVINKEIADYKALKAPDEDELGHDVTAQGRRHASKHGVYNIGGEDDGD